MKTRKPTQAERIQQLCVERNNRKDSMASILAKSGWTRDDLSIMQEHQAWLKANVPEINGFYKPAFVAG